MSIIVQSFLHNNVDNNTNHCGLNHNAIKELQPMHQSTYNGINNDIKLLYHQKSHQDINNNMTGTVKPHHDEGQRIECQ